MALPAIDKSQEWLDAQRSGIGSSDAAAACGLSPWKTAHQLCLEKMGVLEPQPIDPSAARWGTVLEPVIAQEYERDTGLKVRNRNGHLAHKKYPWMVAELDRHIVDMGDGRGPGVLEIKTGGEFVKSEWGIPGTDEVPEQYLVQVQHQLAVVDWQWANIAVLLGGRDFRIYSIDRDDELIEMMIDAETELWDRVRKHDPPDPDWDHKTTPGLLTRIYRGTDGGIITLPDEAEHWFRVWEDAKSVAKQYGATADTAKAHLRHMAGNAAVALLPGKWSGGFKRKKTKRKGYQVADSEYIEFKYSKKLKGDE